jgi:hypothetical protein
MCLQTTRRVYGLVAAFMKVEVSICLETYYRILTGKTQAKGKVVVLKLEIRYQPIWDVGRQNLALYWHHMFVKSRQLIKCLYIVFNLQEFVQVFSIYMNSTVPLSTAIIQGINIPNSIHNAPTTYCTGVQLMTSKSNPCIVSFTNKILFEVKFCLCSTGTNAFGTSTGVTTSKLYALHSESIKHRRVTMRPLRV